MNKVTDEDTVENRSKDGSLEYPKLYKCKVTESASNFNSLLPIFQIAVDKQQSVMVETIIM